MINFTGYSYDNFRWEGKYVAFSTHAKMEMQEFKLDTLEIIDMLHNPVPCPDGNRPKKREIKICSNKNKMVFLIKLFDDYCFDVGEPCWCVKHVKPT